MCAFASARAPEAPPTPQERETLNAVLARLISPRVAACWPLPVSDTIRSLSREVVRTLPATPGGRFCRITVNIRTRPVHWDPSAGRGEGVRSAGGTVGWYTWRWEFATLPTPAGLELTITADNTLMLDPTYTTANESDVLGRYLNEALLYHELLHGQLLINAMSTTAWRSGLCQTGSFDPSGRDAGHAIIQGLEKDFLARRAGPSALDIPTPAQGGAGSFSAVVGRLPQGYEGRVSVAYRMVAGSNVQGLRLEMPPPGVRGGEVVIRGDLVDPGSGGFLLAAIVSPDIASGDSQSVAAMTESAGNVAAGGAPEREHAGKRHPA